MTTPKNPLLSLIIPTRERDETLPFTIETALDQASNDYEIIVSDNCSQDTTRNTVAKFSDARLRYVNTGARVSMCDNWEFALRHATGDYVMFIGDDDAVMPGAIDWLQSYMRSHPSEVYCWPYHTYVWPIDGRKAMVLDFANRSDSYQVDLAKMAGFIVSHGGWKHYHLPSVYHSAISRRITDTIRERTGRVFHTMLPDVFMSMAIPAFTTTALNVGQCITVHGRSQKANGGAASNAKQGVSTIKTHIEEFGAYQFHPTLYPHENELINVIPDTVLHCMELFPEFYGQMKFDYTTMLAYVWRLNANMKQPCSIMELIRKRDEIRKYHPLSMPRLLYYFAFHKAATMRINAVRRWNRLWSPRPNTPGNIRDFIRQADVVQSQKKRKE